MTQTAVIDLGPGNIGTFGPASATPVAECAKIAETACDPKYNKPATRRYVCVDGRLFEEEAEMLAAGISPEEVDPQLAGGKVLSEVAASYMDDLSTHRPESQVVAEKTRQDVEDGFPPTVHGDEAKDEEGCAANVRKRECLKFNAENADVVAPLTMTIVKTAGVDHLVNEDDIAQSIVNGKVAADNDGNWDVSAKEIVEIMVANGAQYIKCVNSHEEAERVDFTENGFSKVDYARENSTDSKTAMVFSASLGKYLKDCFEQTLQRGGTERDAALKFMRVVLFNAGMSKILQPENSKVGLVLLAKA